MSIYSFLLMRCAGPAEIPADSILKKNDEKKKEQNPIKVLENAIVLANSKAEIRGPSEKICEAAFSIKESEEDAIYLISMKTLKKLRKAVEDVAKSENGGIEGQLPIVNSTFKFHKRNREIALLWEQSLIDKVIQTYNKTRLLKSDADLLRLYNGTTLLEPDADLPHPSVEPSKESSNWFVFCLKSKLTLSERAEKAKMGEREKKLLFWHEMNKVFGKSIQKLNLTTGQVMFMDTHQATIIKGKDKLNGWVVIEGKNQLYTGHIEKGKPHGLGIRDISSKTSKLVRKYEGELYKGQARGYGIETVHDNWCVVETYEGQWNQDKREGWGKLKKFENKQITATFSGLFENNQYKTGKMTFSNQGFYEGEWKGGVPHGKGFIHYPNGSWYHGEWENGKRSGKGTVQENERGINKDFYKGEWKDNQPHGEGKKVLATGEIQQGEWRAGLFIKGKKILVTGEIQKVG